MPVAKSNGRRGSKPSGSRARSVGAAGGMNPNGAILDDQAEVIAQQKRRFKAWSEGYRGNQNALKPMEMPEAWQKMYRGQ